MRILFVNEVSIAQSGLGNLGKMIMQKFKQAGIEFAELACGIDDKTKYDPGWKFYPARPSSPELMESYLKNPLADYGAFPFESVCLDYKPDIVFALNDPHAMTFINKSPLRQFYKVVLMPTIDSLPVKASWDACLRMSDKVLFYSDWAAKNTGISGRTMHFPVSDAYTYNHEMKTLYRSFLDVPEDVILFGSVFKNQPRKLVGDLLLTFNEIKRLKGDKVKLLLHTGVPGVKNPWNIINMVNDLGLQNDVYFTYKCLECEKISIGPFVGYHRFCKACGKPTSYVKNERVLISENEMSQIYGCMDYYLQFASAEGACLPIAEAAKCGLKVFCPLTTAMQDFGSTIDAVGLDYSMTYHNSWDSMRASMSNHKANADIIVSNMGEYDGSEISKKACSIYSIDKFVSDLMQEFVMVGRPNLSWDDKNKHNMEAPTGTLDLEQFGDFLLNTKVLTQYEVCTMLSSLTTNPIGLPQPARGTTTKEILSMVSGIIKKHNFYEDIRWKQANTTTE